MKKKKCKQTEFSQTHLSYPKVWDTMGLKAQLRENVLTTPVSLLQGSPTLQSNTPEPANQGVYIITGKG